LIRLGGGYNSKPVSKATPTSRDALAADCRVQVAMGVEAEGQKIADPADGGVTFRAVVGFAAGR
jgi:hypothetical protein